MRDAGQRLDEYEKVVKENPDATSPLYFLAFARYARYASNLKQSAALLHDFKAAYGENNEWVRQDDIDAVAPGVFHVDTSNDSDQIPEIETKWNKLKKNLKKSQQEPMERLMKLTGLDAVKQQALNIYADILADQKLKRNDRENAIMKRTLNFSFMGNPGTGKTTVARIFADLLEAAGARAGHKFVQMTAHQAIRKGADKFATELASLTGGTKGIGPPPMSSGAE